MNIFVLDLNPAKAAQYHCDNHVVKMILESAQIISTTLVIRGFHAPYKATHRNHPCCVWARESYSNYQWLLQLFEHLHKEWQYRWNHTRNHLSYDKMAQTGGPTSLDFPSAGLTPFAQAMPESCRRDQAVTAYRTYYREYKKHLLHYTKRERPEWL